MGFGLGCRLDLPTMLKQCEDIFGTGQLPDTNATNQRYGSIQPKYTNVFFSDFSDDPWQVSCVIRFVHTV